MTIDAYLRQKYNRLFLDANDSGHALGQSELKTWSPFMQPADTPKLCGHMGCYNYTKVSILPIKDISTLNQRILLLNIE